MSEDVRLDLTPTVAKLLNEGVRVVIYAGDQDMVCNWMGNKVLIKLAAGILAPCPCET